MNTHWIEFWIVMAILTGALILTVYWPWPDVMDGLPPLPPPPHPGCTECAATIIPPCSEHRLRDLAGMWPDHPERLGAPVPDDGLGLLDDHLRPAGLQADTNPTKG